ncbi:outer membrane beta-barrel protein [Spirosoma arcticum]
MRIGYGVLLLLLSTWCADAQPKADFTIQGAVIDSATRYPLPQATVSLRSAVDSSLLNFQSSDAHGRFIFRNLPKGTYRLVVSYVGYHLLRQSVVVSAESQPLHVGTLILRPRTVRLGEVTVQRRAPVRVSQDTLEFDAGAFATRPDALVEDLLRKLPGMEIAGDGSVRAQGKIVQQVFVNGKPFFGSDPKMATRNLPAHLIDKIQVYDKRSDQSAFSGMDDGGRVRTINIITKPEGRRGQFGQQVVGYGTDSRYQAGGGINRFREQKQVSLLGQTNNINQPGYGLPAYGTGLGAGANSGPGQTGGITRATGAGLHYADRWGKRTEMAASYLFADAVTQAEQLHRRQTLLPGNASQPGTDSSLAVLVSDNANRSTTRSANHSVNLQLTYQADSMNVFRLSPNLSTYTNSNASGQTSRTFTDQSTPLNQSLTDNRGAGTNLTVNNTLLWMHRFHRTGRTFSLNLNTAINRLASQGVNRAHNTYYEQPSGQDSLPAMQTNQRNAQRTRSINNDLTLSFTEPLGARQTLEFRYNLFTNRGVSERTVWDVDETTGLAQSNAQLSSQYQSVFVTHRLGTGWQVRRPHYSYTAGLDLQQANLRSAYQTGERPLNRQYVNLLPNFMFRPQLAPNQYLQLQYQTRIAAPSVTQLQPVADVTNPLFIRAGNPALRPEFTHALSVNYNRFQTTTYRTVFALLSVGMTNHRIVTATTIDAAGVQTIRPVNANGYTTASGTVSVGRPLRVGHFGSTLNLTTNLNLTRGVSFINAQTNRSLTWLAGQVVSLNATLANTVEIGLSGTVNYQRAFYSLQTQLVNQSYTTLLSTQLYCPLPMGFKLATDLTYTTMTGRSAGFNKPFVSWNGYVSRTFFKRQPGELRLQVFDLLNQNQSLIRIVTDTSIEDSQSQVLKRYVLLSFIYNLRQFGSDRTP